MNTWAKPGEEWRATAGYPGYEVSDCGRVRSIARTLRYEGRFGMMERAFPAKLRVQTADKKGRPRVFIKNADGKGCNPSVSVLIAAAFIGPRPEGAYVCHDDGVATNNGLFNLRYDSPSENSRDKVDHHRQRSAKLAPEHVLEIYAIRWTCSARKAGQRFSVDHRTVLRIWRNQGWIRMIARNADDPARNRPLQSIVRKVFDRKKVSA